jgi:hypothetical protein
VEWHNVLGMCTKACPSLLPCFGHSSNTCATEFDFILFNFIFLWYLVHS